MCFAFDEEGVLFPGDHVMGWSTTVVSPPDGDMAAYIDSLRKVAGRGDRTYWPTHGPSIPQPQRYVDALVEHRLERERQVLDAVRGGPGEIPAIVALLYADVDEELHKPAGRIGARPPRQARRRRRGRAPTATGRASSRYEPADPIRRFRASRGPRTLDASALGSEAAMSSSREVSMLERRQRVDEADPVAASRRCHHVGHDEGDAGLGPGSAPRRVAGVVPPVDGEQHDRQLWFEQQREAVAPVDLGGERPGDVERASRRPSV